MIGEEPTPDSGESSVEVVIRREQIFGRKEIDDYSHNGPRIYPIVIYPFSHPKPDDLSHLEVLYEFLSELDTKIFFRPITVINRQTIDRVVRDPALSSEELEEATRLFTNFLRNTVEPVCGIPGIHPAWCVDTCQMWLAGFGMASDKNTTIGAVYWLIPGDFHYGSANGRAVLEKTKQIPLRIYDNPSRIALAIGEVTVNVNSAKQLIDTYGTYGLLYNWFPAEAQEIRKITDKPRTEFFAISDEFLKHALDRRWYAYEQTIVLLLHAFIGHDHAKQVAKVPLGFITDEEAGRGRLDGAMQQVERAERVLKVFWRDRNSHRSEWRTEFRTLDAQSEKIRNAAMVIFEQILTTA